MTCKLGSFQRSACSACPHAHLSGTAAARPGPTPGRGGALAATQLAQPCGGRSSTCLRHAAMLAARRLCICLGCSQQHVGSLLVLPAQPRGSIGVCEDRCGRIVSPFAGGHVDAATLGEGARGGRAAGTPGEHTQHSMPSHISNQPHHHGQPLPLCTAPSPSTCSLRAPRRAAWRAGSGTGRPGRSGRGRLGGVGPVCWSRCWVVPWQVQPFVTSLKLFHPPFAPK